MPASNGAGIAERGARYSSAPLTVDADQMQRVPRSRAPLKKYGARPYRIGAICIASGPVRSRPLQVSGLSGEMSRRATAPGCGMSYLFATRVIVDPLNTPTTDGIPRMIGCCAALNLGLDGGHRNQERARKRARIGALATKPRVAGRPISPSWKRSDSGQDDEPAAAESEPESGELCAECEPELDGHVGAELAELAELDGDSVGELEDGHGVGESDGELDVELDGAGSELAELLGEGECERDVLADGDGEPVRCGRWWCRLPMPRGGPGLTGGRVGFVLGPLAPVPGATGTTTPAPSA